MVRIEIVSKALEQKELCANAISDNVLIITMVGGTN